MRRYKLRPRISLMGQGIALLALGKLCIITQAGGAALFFIIVGICLIIGRR